MILERQILPFWDWLPSHALLYFGVILSLGFLTLLGAFLLTAIRNGPGHAFRIVGSSVASGWDDFHNISLRRVWALAGLAVKESLRRYVLVVFAVFVLILLFAGWYLDVESDNPGRLYISFVLKSTNFLVLLLCVFLSAFSLPNDMKSKTIFTVVTKPVRAWEIIIGRIVGFAAVGTVILAVMCLFSYVFVRRGLHHSHEVDVASIREQAGSAAGRLGRTTLDAHHRHEWSVNKVIVDAEKGLETEMGVTDARMGHSHTVDLASVGETLVVSTPRGDLEARVPIYGKLRFLDRQGNSSQAGINVGKEWTYRGYVEGNTLSAGIWSFSGLRSRDFPEALPLEMTLRVFRTYKGEIERGILGTLWIRHGNPAVHAAAQSGDPAARRGFDADTAVESAPISFSAQEFTPQAMTIPRKINAKMLDGSMRDVDLFETFAPDGNLEIKIQCNERAQYYGMAQADLYLRSADNWFFINFIKTYMTFWLQMLVVISFGIMFSTFLTGSVAMLATLASIVMGYFSQAIADVATGKAEGGGPIESIVRIFKQWNLTTELDGTISKTIIQGFDAVAMFVLRSIAYVMPDFRDYADSGGMNTVRFVASGFDIPANLMFQHALIAFAYVTAATCAAYFFLKSKEIAA